MAVRTVKTLWVEASPKENLSLSSAMAEAFLDAAPAAVGAVERFSVWSDEYVFGMLGYRVETLVVEPTTRWTPEERDAMRAAAIEEARRAGAAL